MLKKIKEMTKLQKIIGVIFIMLFGLALSFGIPTLARYKNRTNLNNIATWDGTIATQYKSGSGTENDPYIISNGAELAYFSEQLLINNYQDTYFSLEKDIVLNRGIFDYGTEAKYILNDVVYYLNGNKYYSDQAKTIEVGTLNTITSLNGFKGYFNGQSNRIYGLYINNDNNSQNALFTNLNGELNNLYVENALIYGGGITGGITSNVEGANLKNILFDGFVVGSSLNSSLIVKPLDLIINSENFITTGYINVDNINSLVGSEILSTTIKGNMNIKNPTGSEIIEVNGTAVEGSFEVELGTNLINQIPVTVENSNEGSVVTLSNLEYIINYNYAVSGGISAISTNTTYENVINKGYVFGNSLSGGLIGVSSGITSINQSYNNGLISSSSLSSGLIGKSYQDNTTITKSYTTANGLIGSVDSSTVVITDSFNTSDVYSIQNSLNSTINVTNSYYTSEILNRAQTIGNFNLTTLEDIKNNILNYDSFVSLEDVQINNQNVWILEDLPILFIDDTNKSLAKIYAGEYSWDNLSFDLNTIKLDSSIAFSIQDTSELSLVKERVYFISDKLLNKEEVENIQTWLPYTNYVQLREEGTYVVYAKITDYSDNIKYLNTDLIIIDTSNPIASISFDNNNWSNYKTILDEIYINSNKNIVIEANDLSGIKSIKYYITDKLLNIKQLNQVNQWQNYENNINISTIGKYIVYAQVVDNNDYTTYINTDYIIYDGYTQNKLYIGKNENSYLNEIPNITNNSSVTINVSYDRNTSLENHTHSVMSNTLLPVGTKMILYTNNKVYEYQITDSQNDYNYNSSCGELNNCIKKANYPFTMFKEIGTTTSKYYVESNVQNNENFTIVLDFKEVEAVVNYTNVDLFIELHDESGKNVRPTLDSTLTSFNIYSKAKAELTLTTDYNGTIEYDSDSSTDVIINSELNYQLIEENKVIDTTYEDQKIGLAIKMFDSNDVIVDKEVFKSIIFKIGDKHYYPEQDNTIHINLNNGINPSTPTLTISTYKNNNVVKPGTYYLKIYNYISYDGHYYESLGDNIITIPVVVASNDKVVYGFDVVVNDEDRIISKKETEKNILFKLLQNGDILDPNIQVSLYKKDKLTAYDQNYSIVDLKNHITNNLTKVTDNIYYAFENPIEYNQEDKIYNELNLNLDTTTLENTSYKFVFDLYDGTKKIGTINKYFIVK